MFNMTIHGIGGTSGGISGPGEEFNLSGLDLLKSTVEELSAKEKEIIANIVSKMGVKSDGHTTPAQLTNSTKTFDRALNHGVRDLHNAIMGDPKIQHELSKGSITEDDIDQHVQNWKHSEQSSFITTMKSNLTPPQHKTMMGATESPNKASPPADIVNQLEQWEDASNDGSTPSSPGSTGAPSGNTTTPASTPLGTSPGAPGGNADKAGKPVNTMLGVLDLINSMLGKGVPIDEIYAVMQNAMGQTSDSSDASSMSSVLNMDKTQPQVASPATLAPGATKTPGAPPAYVSNADLQGTAKVDKTQNGPTNGDAVEPGQLQSPDASTKVISSANASSLVLGILDPKSGARTHGSANFNFAPVTSATASQVLSFQIGTPLPSGMAFSDVLSTLSFTLNPLSDNPTVMSNFNPGMNGCTL
ncbi:MAG: hypothetical protein KBC64_06680, partial [Simkaniaceae bacterium]|nr:hypothetical protein [Simkaniaceae bacterium]